MSGMSALRALLGGAAGGLEGYGKKKERERQSTERNAERDLQMLLSGNLRPAGATPDNESMGIGDKGRSKAAEDVTASPEQTYAYNQILGDAVPEGMQFVSREQQATEARNRARMDQQREYAQASTVRKRADQQREADIVRQEARDLVEHERGLERIDRNQNPDRSHVITGRDGRQYVVDSEYRNPRLLLDGEESDGMPRDQLIRFRSQITDFASTPRQTTPGRTAMPTADEVARYARNLAFANDLADDVAMAETESLLERLFPEIAAQNAARDARDRRSTNRMRRPSGNPGAFPGVDSVPAAGLRVNPFVDDEPDFDEEADQLGLPR